MSNECGCPLCVQPEAFPAAVLNHSRYHDLFWTDPAVWGPRLLVKAGLDPAGVVWPPPRLPSLTIPARRNEPPEVAKRTRTTAEPVDFNRPRPWKRTAPRVGPHASDEDAYAAVASCSFRCTSCRTMKCKGGLKDGQAVTLFDCVACVKREDSDHGTLPVKMVAPGDRRPGIMRGGILQVHVTRACDLSCHHCTQGSNLAGKPAMMTVEEFDTALASLDGYFGVTGVFGGNPCLHPKFPELCEVMRGRVPFERRGIWTNNVRGHGAVCRITFNPAVSNLNVHLVGEAADEIRREWPEAERFIKGERADSTHGAPFVAIKDVIEDEAERWRLIGDCDVNKHWSALIGVVPGVGLRAYFCELAYAQAALHSGAPEWEDVGLAVEPGWWERPMAAFEAQVRQHCHSCGIPLRRPGQLAIGGELEEFSETHAAIMRPKAKGRRMDLVESIGMVNRPARPATEYLAGITPGWNRL